VQSGNKNAELVPQPPPINIAQLLVLIPGSPRELGHEEEVAVDALLVEPGVQHLGYRHPGTLTSLLVEARLCSQNTLFVTQDRHCWPWGDLQHRATAVGKAEPVDRVERAAGDLDAQSTTASRCIPADSKSAST
jgi:hypothetical protein